MTFEQKKNTWPAVLPKDVNLTGLLGGHTRRLWVWGTAGSRGGAHVRWSGGRSPPEAEAFLVKLDIIFALKYNKQRLLLLLAKINLA